MRAHQVSYLAFLAEKFKLYSPVVPYLADLFEKTQCTTWTDLASGAGGPINFFKSTLKTIPAVLLTDKYPPMDVANLLAGISYHANPVDIASANPPQTGLITIFNGFHHLSEAARHKLLQHVAETGRPFLACEILTPSMVTMLKVLVATTIGQLLFNPFVKPFRWHRVLCTYLLPLHLLTTLYDGLVSVLKSPSPGELKKLTSQYNRHGYSFVILPLKGRWVSGTLLIGKPAYNCSPPHNGH
jgi:hypothetical protein